MAFFRAKAGQRRGKRPAKNSNRSQKTSKCGKNISDTLSYALCATFLFLPHFDVICDLLLNRRTATWNLFDK